jgi:hypothetical protein
MKLLLELLGSPRRRGKKLAGLLLLAAYLLAMWQWNAVIARHQATEELRLRIVPWVTKQPPKNGGYAWADLERAVVVTPADAAFLQKHGFEYQSIGPESTAADILFVKHNGPDEERHIRCDGSTSYTRRWPGPGGRACVLDVARPDDPSKRVVRFVSPNGAVIKEFAISRLYREVLWSPTCAFAAMNAPLEGAQDPITIWRVDGNRVKPVDLPPDFTLEALLFREAAHVKASWGLQFVEARDWVSADELFVLAEGAGVYTTPDGDDMGFHLKYRVTIDVSNPQRPRVSKLVKAHFAASPSN